METHKQTEIRATSGPTKLTSKAISGTAIRFHDGTPATEYELLPGLFERIAPTVADHTLRSDGEVLALFNHNPDMPLARRSAGTLKLSKHADGIHYAIRYDPSDPDHKRLKAKLASGTVQGASFGFRVREESFTHENGKDYRTIVSADLVEVSPTPAPAYSGTSAKFRSTETAEQIAERYRQWQETEKRHKRAAELQ